jgi:hypothetical protein
MRLQTSLLRRQNDSRLASKPLMPEEYRRCRTKADDCPTSLSVSATPPNPARRRRRRSKLHSNNIVNRRSNLNKVQSRRPTDLGLLRHASQPQQYEDLRKAGGYPRGLQSWHISFSPKQSLFKLRIRQKMT